MILPEFITASAAYNEVPDDSLSVYIGFQASELFFQQHDRFPGSLATDTTGQDDLPALTKIASDILVGLDGGEASEELTNVLSEM